MEKKVYEVIIDDLKEKIRTGEITNGDKLPGERELSEKLSLCRSGVREALKILVGMGIVECTQGSGYYLKKNFEDSMLESFNLFFLAAGQPGLELIDFRQAIEEKALELAIDKISEEKICKLEDIVMKLSDCENQYDASLDAKFHEEIIKASENIFFISLYNSCRITIKEFIGHITSKILRNSKGKEKLFSDHEEILKYIKLKKKDKALKVLRSHFELMKNNYE